MQPKWLFTFFVAGVLLAASPAWPQGAEPGGQIHIAGLTPRALTGHPSAAARRAEAAKTAVTRQDSGAASRPGPTARGAARSYAARSQRAASQTRKASGRKLSNNDFRYGRTRYRPDFKRNGSFRYQPKFRDSVRFPKLRGHSGSRSRRGGNPDLRYQPNMRQENSSFGYSRGRRYRGGFRYGLD